MNYKYSIYLYISQRSRYTRVNSLGGSLYGGAAEYDDPANCAEEDQYGSQYQPYGAPCDHYGSRKSIGIFRRYFGFRKYISWHTFH